MDRPASDCNSNCLLIGQLVSIITLPVLLVTNQDHPSLCVHTSIQIYIRKTINLEVFLRRFHDQFFTSCSFQIAPNTLEGILLQKLWSGHISCSTIHIIGHVRRSVNSKIQEHSNHTTVVDITRGRLLVHMFGKRLPFDKCEFYICSSNIEAKRFLFMLH